MKKALNENKQKSITTHHNLIINLIQIFIMMIQFGFRFTFFKKINKILLKFELKLNFFVAFSIKMCEKKQ